MYGKNMTPAHVGSVVSGSKNLIELKYLFIYKTLYIVQDIAAMCF